MAEEAVYRLRNGKKKTARKRDTDWRKLEYTFSTKIKNESTTSDGIGSAIESKYSIVLITVVAFTSFSFNIHYDYELLSDITDINKTSISLLTDLSLTLFDSNC